MPLLYDDALIFNDVANECGYTDDSIDEQTKKRLKRYIKQGAALLEKTAGSSIDFTKDVTARGLLVDYCRYANSQLVEIFKQNYETELAELNATYLVKARLEKGGANEQS